MRLAIIHYHLRKGGVTRVIASALEALGGDIEAAVVLSSTESEEPLPCPVGVIPGLAYDSEASPEKASALHKAITETARKHLGGPPDIWHIHNHGLGKNTNFPAALNQLINNGARVLLQIHDFAEDGRPDNYRAQKSLYEDGTFSDYDRSLYPIAPQIAYAVLNGRDQDILKSSGIPAGNLFWLPNAVSAPGFKQETADPPERSGELPLVLYPTRAIRRKNVGELLLLAAANPGFRFATTLSPKNKQWAPIHEAWVALRKDLNLNVQLALGEQPGQTYASLINEAQAMVTTSVGEGFGLAFLEPWLFGKPVTGRDLPEVTDDFKANGIQLPDLYTEWRIPCTLFDVDGFRSRLGDFLQSIYAAYGRSLEEDSLRKLWQHMTNDGMVDFSCLDETAQAEALRKVCREKPGSFQSPVNLENLNHSITSDNANKISEVYGLDNYKTQLLGIYQHLLKASPAEPVSIPAGDVLDAFLNPARLRMLRS